MLRNLSTGFDCLFIFFIYFIANLTSFDSPKFDDYVEPIGWVMLIGYMLIANVMMLNLLIAIFG